MSTDGLAAREMQVLVNAGELGHTGTFEVLYGRVDFRTARLNFAYGMPVQL